MSMCKEGGGMGAKHAALRRSCAECKPKGCKAASLGHLWSEVQDPVAQMAVQTQVL